MKKNIIFFIRLFYVVLLILGLGVFVSASSRIEQLTPINFEHFRSQTCSGDVSYGS